MREQHGRTEDPVNRKKQGTEIEQDEKGGEESSDEDSIEGFVIDDEAKFDDKKFKTNYLHVCLECKSSH